MAPLFISLGNLLQLMVIRDPETLLNQDSILIDTYNIFADVAQRDPRQSKSKEGTLHLERINDPEYYGFLTRQNYDSLYTYTADGKKQLSADELAQVIKQIAD